MYTSNYHKIRCMGGQSFDLSYYGGLKQTNGDNNGSGNHKCGDTTIACINNLIEYTSNTNYGYCYLLAGTGDTLPTVNDYKLEAAITTGLKHISDAMNFSIVDGIPQKTITRTLQNISGAEMTIKEIGLYTFYYFSFLIAREVLPNPVTVAANEVFSISMILK